MTPGVQATSLRAPASRSGQSLTGRDPVPGRNCRAPCRTRLCRRRACSESASSRGRRPGRPRAYVLRRRPGQISARTAASVLRKPGKPPELPSHGQVEGPPLMMIRDPSLFKFCLRVNSGVNAGPATAAGRRSGAGGPQASQSGLGRRRGSGANFDSEASRSGLPGAARGA